jgi:PAS domain S-box-containing protein
LANAEDTTERYPPTWPIEGQQLPVLFGNSQDAIVLVDDRAHYVYANPAACSLLGYEQHDLLNMTIADVFGVMFDERLRGHWQQVLASGNRSGDFTGQTQHGRAIEVEYELITNLVPGLHLAILRDVTEHKRKAKLQKLRSAVVQIFAEADSFAEAAPRLLGAICEGGTWGASELWRVDDQGTLRWESGWNAAPLGKAEIMQVRDEATVKLVHVLTERIWLSKQAQWIGDMVAAGDSGGQAASRTGLRTAAAFPLRHDGEMLGVVACFSPAARAPEADLLQTMEDIGSLTVQFWRRRRAEQALQASEIRFRNLVEVSPDAIILLDMGGWVIMVNQRAANMFGFEDALELVGRNVCEFLPREDWERTRAFILNLDAAAVGKDRERTLIKRDGSRFFGEISMALMPNKPGQPATLMVVARDITMRKQTDDELRKSTAHLSDLSKRIVNAQEAERHHLARELHDQIGQNLTALNINLNYLRTHLLGEADLQIGARLDESMALVDETIERVRGVITELRPSVLDDYGLGAALRWYVKQFTKRTGLKVDMRIDEDSTWHRMPSNVETALFRVAQEGLTNIAKHAGADQVTVRLNVDSLCVNLAIADNGIGFDPAAARPADSMGLIGIQERVAAVGGVLLLESVPDEGTRLLVEVRR